MMACVPRIAALSVLFVLTACGAVYPRYTTLLRDAPAGLIQGGELTPPPDTVHRLSAVRAELPRATRDGRNWDNDPGPDPFIIVLRNGSEIFRSRAIENTLRPVWDPSRDYADVRISDQDQLRVELRDRDSLDSELVGLTEFRGVPEYARGGGLWTIRLEGGATVELQSAPPPPRIGMGVTYEYRGSTLGIVAVEQTGPAYEAGVRAGDWVTAINGRSVAAMSELDVRNAMDRGSITDVTLLVDHANGVRTEMVIRRNAVYPAR